MCDCQTCKTLKTKWQTNRQNYATVEEYLPVMKRMTREMPGIVTGIQRLIIEQREALNGAYSQYL